MAVATTSVQLRASEPVAVERYDRQRGEWLMVCVAPCQASVPVGSRLRVPADVRHDVAGSRRFRLHEGLRAATIDVRSGSVKQRAAGAGIALMSMVGVISGIRMLLNARGFDVPDLRANEGYYLIPISTVFVAIGVGITVVGKSRLRQSRPGRVAAVPGGIAF